MIHYYKAPLIHLFSELHKIYDDPENKAPLCLEIQETIIAKITYIERQIRRRKIFIKELKKQLRNQGGVRISKDEASSIKQKISDFQTQIKDYQELTWIFRVVGDGLAFIFIDKWNIRPLPFKQTSGFISGKKGSRLERKILRKALQDGHIVLLNDITNCLRYGDITVPKGGKFMIIEAKSGKSIDKRGERQLKETNKIIEYLDTDRTNELYGLKGIFRRISLSNPEINNRNKLNKLITTALETGLGYAQVEPGLHYFVFTKFDMKSFENVLNQNKGEIVAMIINQIPGNLAYFPVALSILDPEAIYKFYSNELNIVVAIDIGKLNTELQKFDLEITLTGEELMPIRIVRNNPSQDDLPYFDISYLFWGRIFAEFLSLSWFIKELLSISRMNVEEYID